MRRRKVGFAEGIVHKRFANTDNLQHELHSMVLQKQAMHRLS